jgi:hypothetical protein
MAIFSTKKTNTIIYYTTKDYAQGTDAEGNYTRNQDDEFVYATKGTDILSKNLLTNKLSYIYFVRFSNGQIYDHRCLHSLPENKESYVNKVCKNDLKWIKVDAAAFKQYLDFLKLESDQHYKVACRSCSGV